MMGPKPVPNRADLVDYNYAVAGHAGTLCDPDGELFIKPCTQPEIDFYQSAMAEHPRFADLMPVYMGSLMLNDATDVTSIDEQLPVIADHISQDMKEQVVEMMAGKAHEAALQGPPETTPENIIWNPNKSKKIVTDTALVLENAAYGFKNPNIMDVKLGIRLWADDAPLEKKQRFDKISGETTHRDLGFRIAGMRVYRGSENPAELDREDYRIYDKDYGRTEVNTGNIVEAFRKFVFNPTAGIDEEIGKAVADAFKRDLEAVRDVLEREESRMYSASLLFVFEGDGAALRAAVDEMSASAAASKDKGGENHIPGRSALRVDSGIDMGDDGELILPGEEESGDDDDDIKDEPRIYTLKLIDFAHAQWTPGQGPDENALTGVRSLVRIFDELAQ
ncbi:putative inositol polyphosphate multikinase protein [Phaeoacremonium minimum UCRPA7]|uniref:Kinase n=1 Tax=Phaeoacremonium minimum (strain UCR-PA7) TaxID=1286976 RepID=R8BL93_PHAM7|nr:putative inositol polyphosphate multikinase protein [Phaeoacremonium minimum UCRPA7]EOO00124.1 putative inositol polyphosphate multikinase protein [Phaeoacremonium minimum UCRPA7]